MDKLARNDWKRHSAPYELTCDISSSQPSVTELFDQAMEAFISGQRKLEEVTQTGKSATLGRNRKKIVSVTKPEKAELSTDQLTPGVLKLFGETIVPGVQYKSVLASCRSTAQELVKQALERFGLPKMDCKKFVLCDVVGRYESRDFETEMNNPDTTKCSKPDQWEGVFARELSDGDRPLMLQQFWRPIDGYQRRYELRRRANDAHVTDDDDTCGLNENARKILISKLRPGAIPLFDASTLSRDSNGLKLDLRRSSQETQSSDSDLSIQRSKSGKSCIQESNAPIPLKHPHFLNIRGFDVKKDKTIYVIKFKRFTVGNPHYKSQHQGQTGDVPVLSLYAPDLNAAHCNVKVYTFKKTNGTRSASAERSTYFLELEPLSDNISVNGNRISGKVFVKSGDIINLGLYYVFLFKDCSKGFDIPLSLPWLPVPSTSRVSDDSEAESVSSKLGALSVEDTVSNTDESVSASVSERMSLSYCKEKEDDLVKYICAIIQQQNTSTTYPLTVAFLFSMCIEHASTKFDRRQLKHLFLRILLAVRESVAETATSLSTGKFKCSLLDVSLSAKERDQKLERLLLWISNCVQLLLFLKNSFHLAEVQSPDDPEESKFAKKGDGSRHSLAQLITGLEEIIMFCFQQCVYTITKALHPILPALLNSNPFNDVNSEQSTMEEVIRVFDTLAEVTHTVMLHEGITRQLFTYLFFFTNANVFNTLMDKSWSKFYSWQCGIRIRANLSELEDWATQNGLEDEFGQMFESLLTVTELLATSKNTLVKYEWRLMRSHFRPLTVAQLHHVLSNYQLGKPVPTTWTPSLEDYESIQSEDSCLLPLSTYPPFALPDTSGMVDLLKTPEDTTFWTHLKRLKTLYCTSEDDSDSGFSRSNTPRGSCSATQEDPFYVHEGETVTRTRRESSNVNGSTVNGVSFLHSKPTKKVQLKKCNTNPWSLKLPGGGSCHYSSTTCNKRVSGDTLSSELIQDEKRENIDIAEANDSKSKSWPLKAYKKASQSESRSKHGNIYKKLSISSNSSVSNCSARTLPKKLQPGVRTKSRKPEVKVSLQQSFSSEDYQPRFSRCQLSASFEQAIERGYASDTVNPSGDLSEDDLPDPGCSKTKSKQENAFVAKKTPPRMTLNGGNSVSIFHDEIFIDEDGVESMYTDCEDTGAPDSMPCPLSKYFKPLSTSESNLTHAQKHRGNKLTTVSFDSQSRRSSIELTKDKLILHNARNIMREAEELSDTDTEQLPGDVFTEVNESTLEYLKRHGSAINVAPSAENSPVTVQRAPRKADDIVGQTGDVTIPSRPMYTAHLQKQDGGLGLALIDGLHTALGLSGIYIRKILPDSPAAINSRLRVGDRILAVDGNNVSDASYQSILRTIKDAGDELMLLMARGNDTIATKIAASQV